MLSIVLLCGWVWTTAADSALADADPLSIPQVGSYGLRVLSPTLLELTLINTKQPDPARVSSWDFVGTNFTLTAPAPDQFVVVSGGSVLTVQKVGFKRRPLYAPLKKRDLRIANSLYLQLASAIGDNQDVAVTNPDGQIWPMTTSFTTKTDPLRWSPAVHVNQVGYVPGFPKSAMVGYYLGSLGEMSVPGQNGFQVLDTAGQVVYSGQLTPRLDHGYIYSPAPYQQVWAADFSDVTTPGEYRLLVPGLGTSLPFRIDDGVAANFARTYALGVFHQRCGMKEDFPFTRYVHDACHTRPAQVPDFTFTAVNNELAAMTSDWANSQTAPQLKESDASLYPFVEITDRDVSGGHHDAGDYSRYTINSAGFVHYLVFAADAFPGVAELDNLGLPESGDGKSDILQEAKWEADFLAKMQDADGGFYFLVYPRDREYEDDVLPDKGDPQVVFPKTTAVTAAAVAALAEAGSSPRFREQFPEAAALYLQKARLGWDFLQRAIAKYGKAGAYQKITHYGNEFTHDDELAWAACALFVATGEQVYHDQLKAWYNPADPKTRRWTWWRLFEGYGCATRSYAFAARSGRLPASALNPAYLAKCEAEIHAAATDQVRAANQNAYGTSFPEQNKIYRNAGWYFSSERAFDVTVAYQLDPRADYLRTVLSDLNYEGGCNPVNMTYITGLGSCRQREIVSQYAENDRRVLPPSGIPLGNIQAGYQYLASYQGDLQAVTFPPDNAAAAPYPYYDRWSDAFNTTTEFVITDQARSLASLSFWMAQTSLKTQPWTSVAGQITGLPAEQAADQNVTAALVVPGVDLTGAQIIWEARDQEPKVGNPVTFVPTSAGAQWVEVEALLPDGRRIFATTNFLANASLSTPVNSFESAPLAVTADMVALFHLDDDLSDATGKHGALSLSGQAKLDHSNLAWMIARQGGSLQFEDLGDTARIAIPAGDLSVGEQTGAISIEAMVYIDRFVGYNRSSSSILSLYKNWDAFLQLGEDKYAGAFIRGGTQMELIGGALTDVLTTGRWHHLSLELNQTAYIVRVDGTVVATAASEELTNWARSGSAVLEVGNFAGWIDEVAVRSVRSLAPPNKRPTVSLTTPSANARFNAPATITLGANAADADGTITKVEFYQGSTKLAEVPNSSSPYTFAWTGVPIGNYTITAKATDDRGAVGSSSPVSIVVGAAEDAVSVPLLTPSGGSSLKPVEVSVQISTPAATIRYTLDGSEPSVNSPVYTGPFAVASTAKVQARGFRSGMADSPVASADFVVTTLSPTGTRVTFLTTDTDTQGTWKTTYGLDGYNVFGQPAKTPPYVQLSTAGKTDFSWNESTSDLRALQKPGASTRLARCWYSNTSFLVNLGFTDGKTHRLALYFVDWDRSNRSQSVEILDATSNALLDAHTLSDFGGGKYLVWDLKGRVKIRITRLSGPNAILSGLFFNPRLALASDPTVAPVLMGSASAAGAQSGGFRLHLSGEAGQQCVIEGSRDLVNWTPVSTNSLAGSDLDLPDLPGTSLSFQFYRPRPVSSAQPQ